jgi:hypothetical protein
MALERTLIMRLQLSRCVVTSGFSLKTCPSVVDGVVCALYAIDQDGFQDRCGRDQIRVISWMGLD